MLSAAYTADEIGLKAIHPQKQARQRILIINNRIAITIQYCFSVSYTKSLTFFIRNHAKLRQPLGWGSRGY